MLALGRVVGLPRPKLSQAVPHLLQVHKLLEQKSRLASAHSRAGVLKARSLSTQLGIQVTDYKKDSLDGLVLKELAFPEAGPGQAVVRLVLRPINPVDLELLHGAKAANIKLPYIPGFEGLGIVEQPAAGSEKFEKGQRVVGLSFAGPGAWQQYVAVPESQLIAVPASVSDEAAAQFYVNPITAYGLLEALAVPKGEWLLQTAAGSVLGRLLITLAKREGVKTINVVRRSAQKDELLTLGADEVIATDEEDIPERVAQITDGKGAWAAANPIGGDITAQLVAAVRSEGTVHLYGTLSGDTAIAPIWDLIGGKTLTGFSMPKWIRGLGDERRFATALAVMDLIEQKVIEPLTGPTYKLQDFKAAIKASTEVGRGGKILLSG
ncbi:hypothetical protein WJX74_009098 [Apatococcus lobatus]|uniref:Enoyl reductase (ER) domain-containing protein n=2 Tax=Apatococcus TaxID=904362 RepID=A0AAW1SR52_9CHLO